MENEDQSSTLLAGLAVKPVWTENPDQPSPGGVGNSPCAGDIAGASKPAVGLRWCPRLQQALSALCVLEVVSEVVLIRHVVKVVEHPHS